MSDTDGPARDTGDKPQRGRRAQPLVRRNMFAKELVPMMYSFGDSETPLTDTVNVMEDLLIEHLIDLCEAADQVSSQRGKVKMDDVRHALRKPQYQKQLARVEELLVMDVELRKARDIGQDNFEDYAKEKFDGMEEESKAPTQTSVQQPRKRGRGRPKKY